MKKYLVLLLLLLFIIPVPAQNYSVYPDSALRLLLTTDFSPTSGTSGTVEFWVKRETNGVSGYLMHNDGNLDRVFLPSSSFAGIIWDPDAGDIVILYGDSAAADVDTWIHYVYVADFVSDKTYLYQGNQSNDDTLSTTGAGVSDCVVRGGPHPCDQAAGWSARRKPPHLE